MKIKYIDVTKKPSQNQIKMLNKASMFSASEDDEYPENTEKELFQFKKVANGNEDENENENDR